MSVKPSARSISSAIYTGAVQVAGVIGRLNVVTSGGESSASDPRAPTTLAAPAHASVATKSRRVGSIRIGASLSSAPFLHPRPESFAIFRHGPSGSDDGRG